MQTTEKAKEDKMKILLKSAAFSALVKEGYAGSEMSNKSTSKSVDENHTALQKIA